MIELYCIVACAFPLNEMKGPLGGGSVAQGGTIEKQLSNGEERVAISLKEK